MLQKSVGFAARVLLCTLALWLSSHGAASASVASIICDIYNNEIIGGLAPGVATIGVIAVAISATFGRASAGMALMVVVGIVVLYNAKWLASQFGASGC